MTKLHFSELAKELERIFSPEDQKVFEFCGKYIDQMEKIVNEDEQLRKKSKKNDFEKVATIRNFSILKYLAEKYQLRQKPQFRELCDLIDQCHRVVAEYGIETFNKKRGRYDDEDMGPHPSKRGLFGRDTIDVVEQFKKVTERVRIIPLEGKPRPSSRS